MVSVTHAAEILSSVAHTLTSLSVIVSHLVSNDPLGVVHVTLIGCLCLVAITLIGTGCEILRWKVRQFTRARELAETKPESRRLMG